MEGFGPIKKPLRNHIYTHDLPLFYIGFLLFLSIPGGFLTIRNLHFIYV